MISRTLFLLAMLAPAAWAQHEHHRHKDPQEAEPASPSLPDIELLDQNGEAVRFYSDLVKGRTVAIHSIFTTCTTICPPMGANFTRLQEMLGEDSQVQLISVSIDPAVDTPARLKAWQAKFGASPRNWTLLTGPKPRVDRLLKALGLFAPDKVDHSPTVLAGSERARRWTRANGLASPAKLSELLKRMDEEAAP